MKNTVRIFFVLVIAILFSCEEQGYFILCDNCSYDEPERTELEAKLDLNQSAAILINLYEGTIEDSILISSYESYSSSFKYDVMINKQYTITATYTIGSKKYIAIDSAFPRVRYAKDQCEEPCYFVYDRICDLRLKFTK